MCLDDVYIAHGVVFQGDSLGNFGSIDLSVLRGALVPSEDWRLVLLLEALMWPASIFSCRFRHILWF